MKNQTEEQTGLMTLPYTDVPAQRKSFLGRIFTGDNGYEDNDMQKLTHEHALARRAIQLDTDLIRCRRQARAFLAVTELEDRAAMEVAKVLRCRELCESVEDLFADEPVMAEILKVRVRSIFHGRCGTNGHHGEHRGRYRWNKK
jgi:hypothetical protein